VAVEELKEAAETLKEAVEALKEVVEALKESLYVQVTRAKRWGHWFVQGEPTSV
jgi:predicted RNase H-like HicB family nuclease